MKSFVLALALLTTPAAAEVYVYGGAAVAHDNGVLGLGQWLAYGAGANLGDGSDETGVYYPYTPNVYGGPVAGAFGVRPLDDGRPWVGTITRVELRARIRADTPLGNAFQPFTHKHDSGWGETEGFGMLVWQSWPGMQWPQSPPYVYGWLWQQDVWTDVVATLPFTPLGYHWTRDTIFQSCYGLWVWVPPGGGFRLSEWELRITSE